MDKLELFKKQIAPDEFKIREDEHGTLSTHFFDREMDVVECTFNYDECVNLNTEGLNHIVLTKEILQNLIDAIDETEEIYANQEYIED